MQAQHAKEIKALKEEMADAKKENNLKWVRELQANHDRLLKEQREAAEAREKMLQADLESLRERITELETRKRCIVM